MKNSPMFPTKHHGVLPKMPRCLLLILSIIFAPRLAAQTTVPLGSEVTWDRHSLMFDGRRACLVMGEAHYSRIPESEWQQEVRKMRQGGVNIMATYVFWSHIEERKGIFDWSGRRNLRRFLEICKAEGMPVVLRMGPWCHGEVRCGGLPDWLFDEGVKVRSEDSTFLDYTRRLYRQIFTQVQGLQWKDGGPVIATQFDNEWGGAASYLMALKAIALETGFDLPFYTTTGWPGLRTPLPFGEMIPLYGDYADGFWDRSTRELSGSYWEAFHFKPARISTSIGTDFIDYSKTKTNAQVEPYPYFTCELGGGMMTSYHRRVYLYPEDALAMAVVKLGCGSNLLGYYMYHGGTNPEGLLSDLNEMQRSPYTIHNDLPHKTYDFQAPLGEFGQVNPHYFLLRPLHRFMADFGELLAPMEAHYPTADRKPEPGADDYLRWSYRTDGTSAFVFVNNYDRLRGLTPKPDCQFEVCGVRFPQRPVTIPEACCAVFPVRVPLGEATKTTAGTLEYATAQLVARHEGRIYLMALDGLPVELKADGHVLKNLKPLGPDRPVYKNLYLITRAQAGRLFLPDDIRGFDEQRLTARDVPFSKVAEAGPLRQINMGPSRVAEQPTDDDFAQAARYRIDLPTEREGRLLAIDYRGDVARLYANGRLIDDNFYNGRPFLYGLWRVPAECQTLELRILPLQPKAPIYYPREADTTPGEAVSRVTTFPL